MTDLNTDALRCAGALDASDNFYPESSMRLDIKLAAAAGDAADHIRRLVADNQALHAELMEQARIVGMSGEREAQHLAVMRKALRALSEIMQDARANHVGGWDTADRLMDAEAAIAALKERVGDD